MTKTSKRVKRFSKRNLKTSTGERLNFRAASLLAAENVPDRLSVGQLVFFLHAAEADAQGAPQSFTELQKVMGPRANKTLHTTYKIFLDANRRSDAANVRGLNWLYQETDATDNRRKFLRLTPDGLAVYEAITEAAAGKA